MTKNDGVDGDADVLRLLGEEEGAWLGATTETETMVLTRTRKNEKRKPFKLPVWLKESYYKKYII